MCLRYPDAVNPCPVSQEARRQSIFGFPHKGAAGVFALIFVPTAFKLLGYALMRLLQSRFGAGHGPHAILIAPILLRCPVRDRPGSSKQNCRGRFVQTTGISKLLLAWGL